MVGGPAASAPAMSCYRTVDSTGAVIADADTPHQIDQDLATKMYSTMAALQIVDTVFYEAQRQVSAAFLTVHIRLVLTSRARTCWYREDSLSS